MTIELIPAIDLKGGRCVRLYQGDYGQETVFSEDPVGMASHWEALGASRLHLVDLDGAAAGEPRHLALIRQIAGALKIPVQVGGGIRKLETVRQLLRSGVQRVILGTAAVENPETVKEACAKYGEAVVVGVDARNGSVAIHGWQKGTSILAHELVAEMADLGVKRFIYTDILRDGTLTQPNFEAIAELIGRTEAAIIASGGITKIEDLRMLNQMGAEGAIIGRALYTGDIKLEEALADLMEDGRQC